MRTVQTCRKTEGEIDLLGRVLQLLNPLPTRWGHSGAYPFSLSSESCPQTKTIIPEARDRRGMEDERVTTTSDFEPNSSREFAPKTFHKLKTGEGILAEVRATRLSAAL